MIDKVSPSMIDKLSPFRLLDMLSMSLCQNVILPTVGLSVSVAVVDKVTMYHTSKCHPLTCY